MQEQMIFITTRKDHKIKDPRIKISDSLSPLFDFLNDCRKFNRSSGLDTENSSLNPFLAVPLLEQFGRKKDVFIVDRTCIDNEFLFDYVDLEFIGQNIQYDHTVIKWNEGKKQIDLRRLRDLMTGEQIIRRGVGTSNSLDAIHLRRLGYPYPEDKGTRKFFINKKKNVIFEDEHIIYGGSDIQCLHEIEEKSLDIARQCGLIHRIEYIGYNLIHILGEMCINGSSLDQEKWMFMYNENKAKKNKLEQELDQILIDLGYPTKVRRKQEVIITDLFGNVNNISNLNVKNIKYSSSKQIIEIFKYFKLPVPTMKDKDTYEIKESVGAEALEQYLILNPNTKLKTFIQSLLELAGITKRINSFGLNFIHDIYPDPNKPNAKNNLIRGFHNPLTGKVHTKYKQEFTANGRLSSGSDSRKSDGKQDSKKKKSEVFFNSQNLVKEERYRTPFVLDKHLIEEGWFRTTLDLAGAELVILGAQSGDKKLLELQASDLHSYLATQCYTQIVKYINKHMNPNRAKSELYDLLRVNKIFEIVTITDDKGEFVRFLTREEKDNITKKRVQFALDNDCFIVNKKESKDIRDAFKNVVYGVAYGSQVGRVGETLNIAKDFAQIVLDTMKTELPIAFGYLDRMSQQGINTGMVVFNNRTNSRHIFKSWLDANKYGRELNKSEVGEIERACKNYIISGTQADMIKEAMVDVDFMLRERNHPYRWIFQIHDEFVIDHYGKDIVKPIVDTTLNACNKYLNGLAEMNCNVVTLTHWTK